MDGKIRQHLYFLSFKCLGKFVRAGQSVELDSYPVKWSIYLKDIYWYKNPVERVEYDGKPLSGPKYDPKSLTRRLKILTAEETDSGYYHCEAEHKYHGKLRSRITQLIVGNPRMYNRFCVIEDLFDLILCTVGIYI